MSLRVLTVVGTRPEAIKMAPVIHALARLSDVETIVVASAQHRQMLDQVLSIFDIVPAIDLNVMRRDQQLAELTASLLTAMRRTLEAVKPDLVMVQGDTTTVLATGLAAFYARIPVAHVEAGLRSGDLSNPFPEEANRKLVAVVSRIHLAPTPGARDRLLAECVPREAIVVTGNTVVDALQMMLKVPYSFRGTPLAPITAGHGRLLLLTSHRRESFGQDLTNICLAMRDLVTRFEDLRIVYPVHLNPRVRETVNALLCGINRVHLIEPLDYLAFVNLMSRADVILTDSGGIQEEAPSLGKPLLVLRKITERPEATHAGLSKVIGTDRQHIVNEVSALLARPERGARHGRNPYGDGHASERIAKVITRWAGGMTPLLEQDEEFAFDVSLVA